MSHRPRRDAKEPSSRTPGAWFPGDPHASREAWEQEQLREAGLEDVDWDAHAHCPACLREQREQAAGAAKEGGWAVAPAPPADEAPPAARRWRRRWLFFGVLAFAGLGR